MTRKSIWLFRVDGAVTKAVSLRTPYSEPAAVIVELRRSEEDHQRRQCRLVLTKDEATQLAEVLTEVVKDK